MALLSCGLDSYESGKVWLRWRDEVMKLWKMTGRVGTIIRIYNTSWTTQMEKMIGIINHLAFLASIKYGVWRVEFKLWIVQMSLTGFTMYQKHSTNSHLLSLPTFWCFTVVDWKQLFSLWEKTPLGSQAFCETDVEATQCLLRVLHGAGSSDKKCLEVTFGCMGYMKDVETP